YTARLSTAPAFGRPAYGARTCGTWTCRMLHFPRWSSLMRHSTGPTSAAPISPKPSWSSPTSPAPLSVTPCCRTPTCAARTSGEPTSRALWDWARHVGMAAERELSASLDWEMDETGLLAAVDRIYGG